MADYGKSRFGFRSKSSETSGDARPDLWARSGPFAKPEPVRDHVCRPVIIGPDGQATPGLVDCSPDHPHHHHHHNKETVTTVKESAYRIQPVSQHTKEYIPNDRKMGFSGGLFQRPRTDFSLPEPALKTEGGWARPSPTGWKLPPEAPLEKVTNDVETTAEYTKGPTTGPTPRAAWGGPRTNGRLGRVTNDVDTVAEYARGPMGAAPASNVGRWGPTGFYSEYGGRKVSGTIDSREAVKRYGGQYI